MINFNRQKTFTIPTIIELYRLKKSEDPVILKVTIGEAGIAETTVYLDGIKTGTYSNSFEADLGPNNGLVNKKLEIRSYAGRIITGNPHSSLAITLGGGHEDPAGDGGDHQPTALPEESQARFHDALARVPRERGILGKANSETRRHIGLWVPPIRVWFHLVLVRIEGWGLRVED